MAKTNHSSRSNNPDKGSSSYLKFYGLAFELVIFSIVVIWGGYALDQHLNTEPLLILVGTVIAVAGTIKLLLVRLK
ncbi:MAG: AtpZ/AtpI family protein [Cytophagales bacterium]|nr:AtpZ/AtpI family protein [Cytophagales bacterium]